MVLGLVASVAIVCGALAGGRMFVSTLPGAWFFGPTTSSTASASQPPCSPLSASTAASSCWPGPGWSYYV